MCLPLMGYYEFYSTFLFHFTFFILYFLSDGKKAHTLKHTHPYVNALSDSKFCHVRLIELEHQFINLHVIAF